MTKGTEQGGQTEREGHSWDLQHLPQYNRMIFHDRKQKLIAFLAASVEPERNIRARVYFSPKE